MSRVFFGALMIGCVGLSFFAFPTGCGDNSGTLKECKSRTDCAEGFSCLNKLCHKTCGKDSDCSSTGEKCESSYCGGIRRPDAGEQDSGPPPACTPGDSEACYTGPSGTEGTGICKGGKKTCEDNGQWSECKGEVKPLDFEECNGKDDNCNGKVDEECGTSCNVGATRPCYTGPPSTKDVGPCKAGTETCEKGADGKPAWGQCEGQILPTPPENCANQIDDDCNGVVNDKCDCKPGDSRECKADNGCAGIQACQVQSGEGSKWSVCTASKPRAEECNGLDDDCNGKTDEDKDGNPLTRKCNNVCFEGIETCKGGAWKDCNAEIPTEETCNNKDDDCDGKIDNIKNKEDPLLKGCDTGKPGLCKSGRQECREGKWSDCIEPPPQKEICNELDDDCDGQVDEEEDKPCGDGQQCIKDTLGVKKCISS